MRILVTGAAGLIGGDAVRALVGAGNEVVAVTKRSGSTDTGLRTSISLDLRSPAAIALLVAQRPALIVHAAAVLPAAFEGDQAASAARDNRAMDDVVVAAAASMGCQLVYISSTSLYGCVQTICSEDSPVSPRGPYGQEKYRSERTILALEIRRVILRVSAPYGSRQRSSTVIRKFVHRALRGEDLFYHGTGAREQDFTAVEDISAAIVAATMATGTGIFNIASGKPISMKELAHLVVRSVGPRVSRVLPSGTDDPEEQCRARIGIARAERELQWNPVVDLATGVQRMGSAFEHHVSDPSADAPKRQ